MPLPLNIDTVLIFEREAKIENVLRECWLRYLIRKSRNRFERNPNIIIRSYQYIQLYT